LKWLLDLSTRLRGLSLGQSLGPSIGPSLGQSLRQSLERSKQAPDWGANFRTPEGV